MEEILQEGNKWFVVCYDAGMCGTDMIEKVQAADEHVAVCMMEDTAWEWFWQFNDADDPEDDEGCSSINGVEAELPIWAEEYDPKKHDMKLR